MEQVTINYLAVVIAAFAAMFVGFLWYGPIFGKTWAKLSKIDMSKKPEGGDMAKMYGGTALLQFIIAIGLAYVIKYADGATAFDGAYIGFYTWLCFVATTMAINSIFANKSKHLYMIDAGHFLATFVVMGLILGMLQ